MRRRTRPTISRPSISRPSGAGFILYPGKLTQLDTFRVGCIGAIGRNEMTQAVNAVADALREMGIEAH